MQQARDGDRDAIAALWRVYQPQVLRLLRAQRAPSPEDVASRVWLDVGRALARFEGDGVDFRKWIFTITRRRRLDALRREGRRAVVSIEERLDDVVDPTAGERFEAGESLERALEIVGRLPPATAEAVMLRVVFDLTVPEVADIMGRSPGAVRVLVHRGLGRLRTLVDGDGNRGDDPDVTERRPPALNTT